MATRQKRSRTKRHGPLEAQRKWRINAIVSGILAAGCVLAVVLGYRQLVPHPDLSIRNSAPPLAETAPLKPRGNIMDRKGALLAVDDTRYEVSVSPRALAEVTSPEDRRRLAQSLGAHLHMSPKQIESVLNQTNLRNAVLTEITTTLPIEDGEALKEMEGKSRGWLKVILRPYRTYPNGMLAAHVLGFVSLKTGCGAGGVEQYYDQLLQEGSPQAKNCPSAAYPDRRQLFTLTEKNPAANTQVADLVQIGMRTLAPTQQGVDLVLTIDRGIQFIVERDLDSAMRQFGARRGTVLVMEPKTGNVLAMANRPAFNPNAISNADIPNLLNYAVSSQYDPGSTFKIVTVANALKSGLFTPQSTFRDRGVLRYGGIDVKNWDGGAYGTVDLTRILGYSLNTGAAYLNTKLGARRVVSYTLDFGFGRPTGIDLAQEIPGMVKVPGDGVWSEADLVTNAYGQGISVTPIQLATAISAVANGGLLMEPHVVSAIIDHGVVRRRPPKVVRRVLSRDIADELNRMLADAVQIETKKALIPGWSIAGKTGTSNVYVNGVISDKEFIGSFIGWAPADDPKFLVLIILEGVQGNEYWGSESAAPLFQKVAWELLHYLHIPPDQLRQRQAASVPRP